MSENQYPTIISPEPTVGSLMLAVGQIKEAVELLTGQRGAREQQSLLERVNTLDGRLETMAGSLTRLAVDSAAAINARLPRIYTASATGFLTRLSFPARAGTNILVFHAAPAQSTTTATSVGWRLESNIHGLVRTFSVLTHGSSPTTWISTITYMDVVRVNTAATLQLDVINTSAVSLRTEIVAIEVG